MAEGNSGNTAFTFTVSRSGDLTGTADLTWSTASQTATAGSDYTSVFSAPLHFAAGQASAQVTVQVLGETLVEADETFLVTLSSPTGATIADGQGTGTILNDDAPASAVIVSDPTDLSKYILMVNGTSGNDVIRINSTGKGRTVDLLVNSVLLGRFTPVDELLVYGLDGNDDIAVDPKLNYPAILVGDDGADTLQLGPGRGILIGGSGADNLRGGGTDDLLISGSTAHDHNFQALAQIQREWIKGGDLKNRVNHLSNGGGLNGSYLLNSSTITSDADADVLSGGGGHDWFIFSPGDSITDLTKDDVATLI
jgi:Ca2+-binding RTX toxin-like protein